VQRLVGVRRSRGREVPHVRPRVRVQPPAPAVHAAEPQEPPRTAQPQRVSTALCLPVYSVFCNPSFRCILQSCVRGAARSERRDLQPTTDLQARCAGFLILASFLHVLSCGANARVGVRDLTKIITLPNNNFDAIDEKVRCDSVSCMDTLG
jgi:hypothetical protein